MAWLRLDTKGGGCQVFGDSLEIHPQSLSQFKSVMGPAGAQLRRKTKNKEYGQSQAGLCAKVVGPWCGQLVRGWGAMDVR